MYHWESRKIQGRWVQAPQEWLICIDCEKYGLDPYMLEGREVTVTTKGAQAPRRLGDYIQGTKASQSYFHAWPDNVGDYLATESEQKALKALRKAPACEIENRAFCVRQKLKDSAMREKRSRAPVLKLSPSTAAWQRWACERLDDTLLMMASERNDCPLPANQFSYVTRVDAEEAMAGIITAAKEKQPAQLRKKPDFWSIQGPF